MTLTVRPTRRLTLIGLGAGLVAGQARAATAYRYAPQADDRAVGKATAPVTIIEYGSTGCPHCAHWDIEIFPDLKEKYIDTGKVRFVFRELITGQPQVAAAGFLVARCAPADRYFDVLHDVMRRQQQIVQSGSLKPGFVEVAKAVGMDEAALDACLSNSAALDALNARSQRNAQLDQVEGTPYFIVDGEPMKGAIDMAAFDEAIAAAMARRAPAAKSSPAPRRSPPKAAPTK